jgi:hypothetical protein
MAGVKVSGFRGDIMARAKAANGGKKDQASGGGQWARAWGEKTGRALRPMLPLLFLGAVYALAATAMWIPLKKDENTVLTRERLLTPILNAKPRPVWISESEWRQLAHLALVGEGHSIFEPGLAEELAKAYQTSPLIERVGAVRLHYPATVSIERVAPRIPFARVDADGGYLVVDRSGYVLPMMAGDLAAPGPRPYSGAAWLDLPSVIGVRCQHRNGGERITEAEMYEGLLLLETVGGQLSRAPGALKAVRAQRDPAGTWRLFTSGGPVIEWGYWNDEQRVEGEPASAVKRDTLNRVLRAWDPARLRSIRLDKPTPAGTGLCPVVPQP